MSGSRGTSARPRAEQPARRGTLDYSMTSPKLNPSTGYAISKNGGNSFGAVQTTANGSGPHLSFSDADFDENRWGDYSAITLDPSSGNVRMADECTVPTAAAPSTTGVPASGRSRPSLTQ